MVSIHPIHTLERDTMPQFNDLLSRIPGPSTVVLDDPAGLQKKNLVLQPISSDPSCPGLIRRHVKGIERSSDQDK